MLDKKQKTEELPRFLLVFRLLFALWFWTPFPIAAKRGVQTSRLVKTPLGQYYPRLALIIHSLSL